MVMRVRLSFSKTDAMRYTSNLDLQRTLERTFRRAQLPLTHSEGYTARPKINLASALPLGVTSDCELADIWLEESVELDDLKKRIQQASPPGVQLHQIDEVTLEAPKLQNIVEWADYSAELIEWVPDIEQKINNFLVSVTIARERRGKTYDLRPLIDNLKYLGDNEERRQQLWMRLAARSNATGRPDEVVAALGSDPLNARYHRIALHLRKSPS